MKVYVSGIGGVAMGPLAFIARDMGYEVIGSDATDHGNAVAYMKENGFTVHVGQDGSQLREEHEKSPIDWFVYSAGLPNDHPEIRYAHEVGMKTSKRDLFLNEFMVEAGLQMIAVSGTHGKTNTTAMIAWAMQQAGIPISYSIGAQLPFGPFGKYEKGSRYFIYEADEFDRNFLQYKPAISVITNIDYDHPDTYPDQAEYDLAYAQFIQQSQRVYLYSDAFAAPVEHVTALEKNEDESSTTIPGKYIRQNARLVLEMLSKEFDVPMIDAVDWLNNFPGTSRRMEMIQEGLYSDYAHHPAEIAAVIETGMELADEVIAVYQPHQNVRQHEVMDLYTDCFEGANKVYWLPTYMSREDPSLDVLEPQQLIESLSNRGSVEISDMNEDLESKIRAHLAGGALVICMAAGNLDAWVRETFTETETQ